MNSRIEQDCPALPPTRMRHRGSLIDSRGRVSALCFAKPRPIDMKRATWTNRDEAVTCVKCLALLKAAPQAQHAAAARPQPQPDVQK